MFYHLIKKALFHLNPEQAHEFISKQMKYIMYSPIQNMFRQTINYKPMHCMGLTFKNPLGLAAGFDKNGEYIYAFGIMGFGFLEIGTVTPNPQYGNKKPRLFRLIEAEGLINRMGCNNLGIDRLVENLKKVKYNCIIGINIGKNQDTPIEYCKDDYLICMEKIYHYANYIAINISSPNTPNLRVLQYGEILEDLLQSIKDKQSFLTKKYQKYVPIAIKISPDLTEKEIIQISDSLIRHQIDGVIATNTTLDRQLIKGLRYSNEEGGLSGRPIQLKSTEIIRLLSKELKGKLTIIGVGGIDSLIAAKEKLAAGASLLQIYSGFIYHGPKLIKNIVNYI
ncbi:Dihydroorotate dehydrogenase (quinone) [Candidatus Arsenophonus lipoptenae]|uniref:Dihydroorotate dehydrogenase (quinone) n=1 Tax=Candidatus Arsenophonus lipoptenae TaxID=634113 RepID=A0A109QE79_9GAMM|nr:quinone-dependent dihydroorotate dehydrogenase [Candidatus Arsenophonus lipoptenae]AMA65111.1 Dihydroorotate dehydrogenase (quinone) [Candidatus Arsenophonus lipoptenae]